MPRIVMKPDSLDQATIGFSPEPLREPLFLNSIQKSGSHLLKNVIRMFVPVEQQYRKQFIQWQNLQEHLAAFEPARSFMSYGHLFFSDASAIELSEVRKILLFRDPYDWVLSRARFFLADQFVGNTDYLKQGRLSVDDLLSLMIFGITTKAPSLADMYEFNVAAWLGSPDVFPVKFEELRRHARNLDAPEAEQFFATLLAAAGIAKLPPNWRERVRVGADPAQSGTARENLSGIRLEVPNELPERHKRLVDYAVPGLRVLLGYETSHAARS
ncbi:hypothetical protein ACUXST_000615 [Sphingomonas sp. F9_3S_D5_B_2]